jgi:L-iditol 2-dehydrogenase
MSGQKAVVKIAEGKGNTEIREVKEPVPKSDEIKIEVKAAGICGTDIHIYNGARGIPMKTPVVIGHEFSGVIVDMGNKVKGFEIGDHVTSETAAKVCGTCTYCRSGNYNLCSSRLGIGYWIDGAFTKYIVVPQERVHKLPENIDLMEAALLEPLACCVHEVSEQTGLTAGDLALVSGPGTIGLLTLQVARAEGARVIICGTSQDEERLKLAKKLGADITVNIQKESLKDIVLKETDNDGADVVFECSGSPAAVNLGLEMIKKRGKYTQMGGFGAPVQINLDMITIKEIKLTGSFTQKWSAWKRAIKLLSEKKVETKPLISDVFPITEWREGYRRHEEKTGIKIILTPVG